MRRLCLLPLALLACFASAQDLTKPITYRTVAIPLSRALEQMSKQAVVTLKASDDLANEPIILVVRGAKTSEVMDHIASAVSATWTKSTPSTFYLDRTEEIVSKLKTKDILTRKEPLQKSIDEFCDRTKIDKDWTSERSALVAKSLADSIKNYDPKAPSQPPAFMQLPIYRALARVIQNIGAEKLATLDATDRYCFSSDPNPLEFPIPGDCKAIFEKLRDEQNQFAKDFAQIYTDKPKFGTPGYWECQLHFDETPPKAVVTVQFNDGIPALTMITIINKLHDRSFAYATLNPPYTKDDVNKYFEAINKAKSERPIPISKESKIVQEACLVVNNRYAGPPPLSGDAARLLLNPGQYDPLSFLMSDGFFAQADDIGANLVAYVPDFFANSNRDAAAVPFTPSTFQTMLRDENEVHNGGWIEVTPKQPLTAWKMRTDRQLFGNCLQEGQAQGFVSIESAAKLALSDRVTGEPSLLWVMDQFGSQYTPFLDRDPRLLRFYGSLDGTQLEALSTTGLEVGSLKQPQYELLSDWVYQSAYPYPDTKERYPSETLWEVPTEAVPNGIPNDAVIQINDTVSDNLFICIQFDDQETVFDRLPDAAFSDLHWGSDHSSAQQHHVKELWMAPGKRHDVLIKVSEQGKWKAEGHLNEVKMGDERWSMDKLPEDAKKQWDVEMSRAHQQFDDEQPKETPPPAKPPVI